MNMMWWLNNYATTLSTTLLASSSSTTTTTTTNDFQDATAILLPSMKVTSLARYAVKGLAPDMLHSVHIATDGEGTFPDDRRFALLKSKSDVENDDQNDGDDDAIVKFDEDTPEWIHKQNFLCAFTAPELMATLDSEYKIVRMTAGGMASGNAGDSATTFTTAGFSFGLPNDSIEESVRSDASTGDDTDDGADDTTADRRMLTIWKRQTPSSSSSQSFKNKSSQPLLGPINLASSYGREELATFFSKLSSSSTKDRVMCVSKRDTPSKNDGMKTTKTGHTHQFGNTRAGVRNNDGDTRTVHIVNAATVRQVSEKIGIELDPMRFRPNIVVDGLEPWKEFEFVGRTLRVVAAENEKQIEDDDITTDGVMELDVLSTTVRCAGIGIDPLDPKSGTLDMPILLAKHFPQYGPYLGVYATVKTRGALRLGDELKLKATKEIRR